MMEREHALLKSILETAVDGIIVIDARGNIESVNPATERLFHFTQAELVGQNVKILMPAPYREEHDDYLENYHETGQRKILGSGREVTGQRKDGSTFPLHLAVSEINVGDRTLFAGIVRDITDLKEAQRELTELNASLDERVRQQALELQAAQAELVRKEKFATLGQISGGIAHEIRNPLNVVKTSAYYLLNAKTPTPEKVREHLERIDRQVGMIDNVVTALADVSRMPDPEVRPWEIQSLVRDVIASTNIPQGMVIDEQLPAGFPRVLVDGNQLSIVLRNLVRNALDAMPNGGTLTVVGTADEQGVTIEVRDTGSGISPDDLERITEPFFSTKPRGMGLGLAITKTILEKNRGTIRVSSELGKGTQFFVSLPIAEGPTTKPTATYGVTADD
ncbi:two-component system sensor histidine kinase NtrB [Aureliella helgolandensis]|uniref:Sensor protein FixL n=1 Tax=Aureliella helgolandensis TaxID=2527968 RepID=A0A518GCY9_9BACT|nr:PAS domain S-box protein [Aureliella helgolandensis]QDV26469.1 Sensor protein FixL [Aureliella helgolandensis]